MLPAAIRATASLRGAARLVPFDSPYSRLRLANPVAPSGRPTLPASRYDSPSPPPNRPVSSSSDPPEAASLSWKFITPAMASEPYWAAAPSRSTSTCPRAMAGMVEMSGACEPYATPLPPCQSMIDERWRRLPLTRISVWSGARLRSMAGRTTVDAPPMGWVLTLNDGMTVRSCSFRSPAPWRPRSAADSTSTGTGDEVTVRGSAREPTTTVSSANPASRPRSSSGDSPSASTSAGVMPRARPSSSASVSAGSSVGSCRLSGRAAASASAANASARSTVANRRRRALLRIRRSAGRGTRRGPPARRRNRGGGNTTVTIEVIRGIASASIFFSVRETQALIPRTRASRRGGRLQPVRTDPLSRPRRAREGAEDVCGGAGGPVCMSGRHARQGTRGVCGPGRANPSCPVDARVEARRAFAGRGGRTLPHPADARVVARGLAVE